MQTGLSLSLSQAAGGELPQEADASGGLAPRSTSPESGPLVLVKIGGSTLGTNDTTLSDIVQLARRGVRPVIVHGGGKVISEWLERQGIRPRFVRGLRVTDDRTLRVVIAVLTGLVNKTIVSGIQSLGGSAVGISGVDAGILRAEIDRPELGNVGRITAVDPTAVIGLAEAGLIPVMAPVALNAGSSGPGMLNINADLAAGEMAAALGADRLVMLTDVPGVMDSSRRLIPRLTERQARGLVESKIAAGGMIPKLEACITALGSVPMAHIVDGRRPHVLLEGVGDGGDLHGGAPIGTRVG